MNKTGHLTADELILFMDRELDGPAAAEAEHHLLHCGDCTKKLQRLQSGTAAYGEYREHVLKPALGAPAHGWARLSQMQGKEKRPRWSWAWAALACGLTLMLLYLAIPKQPNAQEVLARAVVAPEQVTGGLLFTIGKESLYRPALLRLERGNVRFQHVQALFVKASYSWERPLSARSFASWRRRLRNKQDSVTSLQDSGGRKFYRLRTSTADSSLRSAALTLRADTYHPAKADFEFAGELLVEVSEQTGPATVEPQQPAPATPAAQKTTAIEATPEDELRVFAALDALDATGDDPIDVKLDAERHAVVVSGVGIAPERRKEIESAMTSLPHTVVRLNATGSALRDAGGPIHAPNGDAGGEGLAFRQSLQERYGGSYQLQAATDKALDAANGLFARAHFMLMLAREFPPLVEAHLAAGDANKLLSLRQRQVGAIAYGLHQLKEELRPLLEQSAPANIPKIESWQSGAEDLFAAARNLDREVSRLLAGRYADEEGKLMLGQLPQALSKVELSLRVQSAPGVNE